MEKDYIKISNVSRRLTGETFKVRRTTKRFEQLINNLNETVEQILSKTELTDEQKKQAEKIYL